MDSGLVGPSLARRVISLWALDRAGSDGLNAATIPELIDDDLEPQFSDPLLEDVTAFAFVLGLAWERTAARHADDDGREEEGEVP